MASGGAATTLAGRTTSALAIHHLSSRASSKGGSSPSCHNAFLYSTCQSHETSPDHAVRYPRYQLSSRFHALTTRRSPRPFIKSPLHQSCSHEQGNGLARNHAGVNLNEKETDCNEIIRPVVETKRRLGPILSSKGTQCFHPMSGLCRTAFTRCSSRRLHTSARRHAEVSATIRPPEEADIHFGEQHLDIRDRLRKWQEEVGQHLQREAIDSIGLSNGWGPMASGPQPVMQDEHSSSNSYDRSHTAVDLTGRSNDYEYQGLQTDFSVDVGDLVQLGRSFTSILGVKVRDGPVSSQFLTSDGRWAEFMLYDIPFRVRDWAPAGSMDALQDHIPPPALTSGPAVKTLREASIDVNAPRSVTGDLINQMRQFHDTAKSIYRDNAAVLDNAYDSLAHPYDLRFGTLASIASTLLEVPLETVTDQMMFAVHQALLQRGFRFSRETTSSRVSGYIQIRSKEMTHRTERVMRIIRQWQLDSARSALSPGQKHVRRPSQGSAMVEAFLTKARQIIRTSRQTRKPTDSGFIGPCSSTGVLTTPESTLRVTTGVAFTGLEQELLQFLIDWACYRLFDESEDCASLPPAIIEATGLYKDTSNGHKGQSTGYLFLQELGVVLPYHSYITDDTALLLPTSKHSRPLRKLRDATIQLEDQHSFVDTLADLRHDWGSLPVYCIDDASAEEIDDGISIEPGPSNATDGDVWVHVHIANPTAYLAQDSVLATMARHMVETFYAPDGNVTMLPDWATQRYWSLAPGRPCLSFSALVARDGRIIDTQIRPGIVNNVQRMTADQVLQAIDGSQHSAPPTSSLIVGGPVPNLGRAHAPVNSTPDPEAARNLQSLHVMAQRRWQMRQSRCLIMNTGQAPDIAVLTQWSKHCTTHEGIHHTTARSVAGDPVIMGTFHPASSMYNISRRHSAREMVMECMIIAGETASRWTDARNVPMLHRSVRTRSSPSSSEVWRDTLESALQRYGEIPTHIGHRYWVELGGKAIFTTRFLEHHTLGVDAYSKVTSPLRRYGDMINHWQIQSVIRQEATTGTSLLDDGAGSSRQFLPYDDAALRLIANNTTIREKVIMRCKAGVLDHWICQLFFRAFYFKETPLPEKLTATILSDYRFSGLRSTVYVHDFGLSMRWTPAADELSTDARPGDVFEVAIDNVDVYKRAVFVRLLRLVNRPE